MIPPAPRSTLFPYTTLFLSRDGRSGRARFDRSLIDDHTSPQCAAGTSHGDPRADGQGAVGEHVGALSAGWPGAELHRAVAPQRLVAVEVQAAVIEVVRPVTA